ncbi:MAG TPA: 7-cyano-7-deazaguanine synthase QueC [Spirochaetota bacterium]|nr:7-cyano-7-deazaguanine synthase QueC [Spirochaetota bacterium]HPI88716.1 7-cyano-7-deazaguanine synthase QueC [Spirochaetota bacterium]HPR48762.1 7-cyano-7-deazaguanine synthase QueC [Spirochaetota bacterium]
MKNKTAVVLLSGGLDSATTAAIARDSGYDLHALTFFYGQRHGIEIECAKKIASSLSVGNHVFINIPAEIFKSALVTGSSIDVPKNRNAVDNDIPATYVPARNIIFLSYALAYGESIGARDIFIGANAVDYSGYPDCRPEFFEAFSSMANIGTRAGVEGSPFSVHTPLLFLKKSEIILKGTALGVDYSLTHSCYDPDGEGMSCGLCDSCLIRMKGFRDAGVPDPTRYRSR